MVGALGIGMRYRDRLRESHPDHDYILRHASTSDAQWAAFVRLTQAIDDCDDLSWETMDDGESVDVWDLDDYLLGVVNVDANGGFHVVYLADTTEADRVTIDVDAALSIIRKAPRVSNF
jgi:hypothetical protein